MNYTFEVGSDNIAYKAITVRLDPGPGVAKGNTWLAYDHDLMRVAAVWQGDEFIDWRSIAMDGSRHPPQNLGETFCSTQRPPVGLSQIPMISKTPASLVVTTNLMGHSLETGFTTKGSINTGNVSLSTTPSANAKSMRCQAWHRPRLALSSHAHFPFVQESRISSSRLPAVTGSSPLKMN